MSELEQKIRRTLRIALMRNQQDKFSLQPIYIPVRYLKKPTSCPKFYQTGKRRN